MQLPEHPRERRLATVVWATDNQDPLGIGDVEVIADDRAVPDELGCQGQIECLRGAHILGSRRQPRVDKSQAARLQRLDVLQIREVELDFAVEAADGLVEIALVSRAVLVEL